MTFLEDFKTQRLFATPYFVLTFYSELQALKDIVLVRGETLSSSIAKPDAEKLLKNALAFYGQSDLFNQYVRPFNQDQANFDHKKYLNHFDISL